MHTHADTDISNKIIPCLNKVHAYTHMHRQTHTHRHTHTDIHTYTNLKILNVLINVTFNWSGMSLLDFYALTS